MLENDYFYWVCTRKSNNLFLQPFPRMTETSRGPHSPAGSGGLPVPMNMIMREMQSLHQVVSFVFNILSKYLDKSTINLFFTPLGKKCPNLP